MKEQLIKLRGKLENLRILTMFICITRDMLGYKELFLKICLSPILVSEYQQNYVNFFLKYFFY